ncbi:hypothetical protein DYF92_08455 [Vibrio parahaemolyticus]|nr:hypothetical protein [Vibrio parahaemolyticus]EGR2148492.1 hypothetical protein [Vibrio parahaemolyticus]EGR2864012.1 hypothetical protein [Vibrio parahaemolyticus]EGR3106007.1 hypothetical protein [Vibrio parahaemolyticus]
MLGFVFLLSGKKAVACEKGRYLRYRKRYVLIGYVMKDSTKEWLGIKPADFIMYAGFILLIPVKLLDSNYIKILLVIVGLLLCVLSCKIGMVGNSKLSNFNNWVKKVAYPVCSLLYVFLAYLSFT